MRIERELIDAAADRTRGYVRRTPVVHLDGADLGLRSSVRVALKLEGLQYTGSFKPRGAFNRMLQAELPATGVIAASGGNHAQAVAFAAARLGCRAEIFVPASAPVIKVRRIESLGACVFRIGDTYDEARDAARKREIRTGALPVHAYDQPEIVAGAGTVARELTRQVENLDVVLVAVGGGGLLAGTCSWLQDRVQVMGVEPEGCPTLARALERGRPVPVPVRGIAADALGAGTLGQIAFSCARRWNPSSVLVSDRAIQQAQAWLWEQLRILAEPGGVTALAALLDGVWRPRARQRVAVLICGANVDPTTVSPA